MCSSSALSSRQCPPLCDEYLLTQCSLVGLEKIPLAYIMVVGAETYGKMLAVKQVDNANPRQFHDTIAKSDKVDKIVSHLCPPRGKSPPRALPTSWSGARW